ncbi:ATP-dependent Clp protease ATP-binding subunit ClpB [Dorcoceras hygrometricum]|uniref:ATP-dependent Clp protease ATP-binding subunit ClpB n=1 Tax=Dorcoceras hygrometricum TaxID=472368 RepID=A0A2Z7BDK1_9LAMI|nr:ATP-dependent Clp protease ATP-binding subunit ClpB [Dorcoceras hygrometricum]
MKLLPFECCVDRVELRSGFRQSAGGNHRSVIIGARQPITARWRHSNPVVTTPTIALDFSDTTQQSASHNVAPNQHSHLPAGILATMRRVVNYHSSWERQQQVALFDASGNPGSTAGRGFNPAGGAPGASSRSLFNVDSSHLTDINRNSYSRRAHRHRSRSKQRRKSSVIYRRRVRVNNIYRGFTGENDEEYRVQNTLSVEQHLEQTKKPAGQNLQEQTVKEDLSFEDDEGQLERRSADKSKLEELLKSGCKREEKKRSLNSVKEQPARTKTSSKQIKLMNRMANWLKSNQLR